jgi:hypothetical protein
MSSELERRLEGLLAGAPEPDSGAGEEALHRALQALQPAPPARRGLRTAVLVFAAALVLLAISAGSLAAAGALHVTFGAKAKPRSVTTQLTLPKGANGVAAIVDGRLSVVTKSGFRLQGQAATSTALSPHALYIAAGIGHQLVALAPSGRIAWSHSSRGRVVAIAWAPNGLRIAYVIRAGRHFVLRAIYGNGANDTVIDRSVRPVRPSWRGDSRAFAYVGAGGKAVVYDFEHRKHSVAAKLAPVTRVFFAPVGKTLVIATPDEVRIGRETVASGRVEALGWFGGLPAAALASREGALIRSFGHKGRLVDNFFVPGRVVGLTGGLVVTQAQGRILAGWREKTVNTLLTLRPTTVVQDLQIG